jgi:hypothetical protein
MDAADLGGHARAPHEPAVAYLASSAREGGAMLLKVWRGSGDPIEMLRNAGGERLQLAGWTADGNALLVIRSTAPAATPSGRALTGTLWRVPLGGGAPQATALAMEGLRDISIHPDGRRLAFNAGFQRYEHWVMEHFLPTP